MGIVIKQSFWSSIFAYIGAALGLINQLFLYTHFLTKDQVGLFSQIQSFAHLLAPAAILGMTATAVKFNSVYKDNRQEKKAFNSFLFISVSIGLMLVITLIILFRPSIISFYKENELIDQYFEIGIILIGIVTYLSINEAISRANLNAVLPAFLKDVLVRGMGTMLLLLYGFNLISFDQAVSGIILLYIPSLIILIIYNVRSGNVTLGTDFNLINDKFKSLRNYALYSVIGSAGAVIVLNVDIQMVSGMIDLGANGIYTRAFYMAVLIELPRRAISQIVSPVIAQAFKNDDFQKVKKLYKNLSINQMAVGCLIFLGIVINLDNIYSLMPNGEEYQTGFMIVYIVGVAKLVDMAFSINGEIILMSKHYRFSTYSIIILAALTVILNFLLIPIYHINGAAYASLIAIILYNLLKMGFLKWKFNLMPFSYKNLLLIAITVSVWYLDKLIPQQEFVIMDILIRSTFVTVLYCGLIVLLRISEDINSYLNNFYRKYNKKNQ